MTRRRDADQRTPQDGSAKARATLVDLVRLLAREAAQQDFEAQNSAEAMREKGDRDD